MSPRSVIHAAATAGLVITAALCLSAAPASATGQTGSIPAGTAFDLGPSPVGLPDSCSFANGDANFVFGGGSTVSYGTQNANGGWGGETLQGPATFYEDAAPIAQGHLTIWFGGGNNARGQNEGAVTINYSGSSPTSGSVEIHVNGQMAVNANGQPTANVLDVHVTCS